MSINKLDAKLMKLRDFVEYIFDYFNQHGSKLCVLRNYQELPYDNIGNDIDLLYPEVTYEFVRNMFDDLEGVVVTGCCDRYYVLCLYLYGVEWGGGKKTIQIDFFRHLCWKGMSYIDEKCVLEMSVPFRDECTWLKIPRQEHEAIISLFSSYLVGGWIKDRYQEQVREVFINKHDAVCGELTSVIPVQLVSDFVQGVTCDDRAQMLKLLPKIKIHLVSRLLHGNTLASIRNVIAYYFSEVEIFYTQNLRVDISLLGPDGAGKTTVIDLLRTNMQNSSKFIEIVHLRPRLRRHGVVAAPVTNPHAIPERSCTSSICKLIYYVFLYIVDKWVLLNKKRNFVLRIWDRYYHDMLADPKRYRMGAPLWLVRLFGRLIPQPDLFLILDVQPEVVRARKTEVSEAESERQYHAYRVLAKELPNAVLIDANGTPEEVVAACERAVVEAMARRLDRRMGWSRTARVTS